MACQTAEATSRAGCRCSLATGRRGTRIVEHADRGFAIGSGLDSFHHFVKGRTHLGEGRGQGGEHSLDLATCGQASALGQQRRDVIAVSESPHNEAPRPFIEVLGAHVGHTNERLFETRSSQTCRMPSDLGVDPKKTCPYGVTYKVRTKNSRIKTNSTTKINTNTKTKTKTRPRPRGITWTPSESASRPGARCA
jgi:hypothetical protein